MQIQTKAQVTIQANADVIFDASTDCQNLPKFFTGYKAIPAIVSAVTTDGLPLHQGSTRIVNNSDGSSIEEVIVSLERPARQEYSLVKGFKPPFSWLVRSANGKWLYASIDGGTQVTWEFNFEIPNIFAYTLFSLVIKQQFQQAQEICLENLKRAIEDDN